MLLGFKKRFVEPIQIGTKVHTMRKPRKVKPKVGETLHMYTGLRTANCAVITKKERLMSTQKVRIVLERIKHSRAMTSYYGAIAVDGRRLSNEEFHQFVKYDGFKTFEDFFTFWFQGEKRNKIAAILDLYHWTDLRY